MNSDKESFANAPKAVDSPTALDNGSLVPEERTGPNAAKRSSPRRRAGGSRGKAQPGRSSSYRSSRGRAGSSSRTSRSVNPAGTVSTINGPPGVVVRYLSENDDPVRLLWKAIHLETQTSGPLSEVTAENVLNHSRLNGTLLAMADGRSRVDIIQAAARIGVDFSEVKDKTCSWNILHAAVSSGSLAILDAVLTEATEVQIKSLVDEYSALLGTTKWTPLLLAVKNGFDGAVERLLCHGADPFLCVHLMTPDITDIKTGNTVNRKEGNVYPIFFATKNCSKESVQLLYDKMVSMRGIALREILDSKGRTVVHYLSERQADSHPDIVEDSTGQIMEYLLSLDGGIHELTDANGNTPLHESCRRGCDDSTLRFIKVLSSVGVNLEREALINNKEDLPPILMAAATGITQSVRELLTHCGHRIGDTSDRDSRELTDAINKAMDRSEIIHAVNLISVNTTPMDEFEKGAFNAFIGLTSEPDQTQLLRVVKRLGPYHCMAFIAEFTVSDLTNGKLSKTRKENKNRTKGGHFLTLLKARLIKDQRQEDWTYIRVVTELTHKKMRGRPRRYASTQDYAATLLPP